MNEFTPVPYGALRAVFRDPSADSGLMVRPVVAFTAPSSGNAMVFGGPIPSELYEARPEPDANAGVVGVPVVVTRRGELRAVRTALPAPESPDDVQDAAPVNIGLVPGAEPGPAFLGLVQSHEDAAEIFRDHLNAATAHKAAVAASRVAPKRPELAPRTVDAQVRDPAPQRPAVARRASRDLDTLLQDARAMTDNDIEAMGESPEDW